MALQPHERFNAVTDWRRDLYNQNLIHGVMEWSRWSMLQIGGFQNVTAGMSSGIYGGHMSQLRPVNTPNFTDGQVWESIRGDWVWESGIEYGVQPTQHSGVYVNGTYYPSNAVGAYAHHADYRLGRIVFDSPIATTGNVVKTDYAHRIPTIVESNEPWVHELLYNSMDIQRDDFLVSDSGSHYPLGMARRSLPTVGIELVNRIGYQGYQLGGGQYVYQDILLYILAENKPDRDQLLDIFANQNDKTIWIPDRALIKTGGNFPYDLDYEGKLVNTPIQYPALVAATGDGGYRWATVTFGNTKSQTMQSGNDWLYKGVVSTTCESIFENL